MTAAPAEKIKERFDECNHLKYTSMILTKQMLNLCVLAKQMLNLYKDAASMESQIE